MTVATKPRPSKPRVTILETVPDNSKLLPSSKPDSAVPLRSKLGHEVRAPQRSATIDVDTLIDSFQRTKGPMTASVNTKFGAAGPQSGIIDEIVDKIVQQHEQHVYHVCPTGDFWTKGGRESFAAKVRPFVVKGKPVDFVLPAFPCKSSNLNKVAGHLPDKGEELAMRTLSKYSDAIKRVYSPGARMLVVSDGHVFSDLVGTDDNIVDEYNAALLRMVFALDPARKVFSFTGLDALLKKAVPTTPAGGWGWSWDKYTAAPLETFQTHEADQARKALLLRFGGDPEELALRLKSDDALMGLARGFSKFVMEDTLTHPTLANLSQSKRKKIAWETAKLMILRNEAYSNLVEVSFPQAVRLSIHPHNNAGPKFAVTLLHPSFRHGNSSGPVAAADLFHIPTPWHNVVLEMLDGGYHVCKKSALKDFEDDEHTVEFFNVDKIGEGAYFKLVKKGGAAAPVLTEEPASDEPEEA